VDEQARNRYFTLKYSSNEDRRLYESIGRTFDKLKYNPYSGDNIKKERIPPKYKHLNGLFKININRYWRMLYTVKSLDRSNTLVIIIDFLPHNEYDRLFGYH
jgi:hypothetical protein